MARSGPRNTRLLVIGLVALSLAIITLDYRQGNAGPLATMGRAAQTFMAPLQEGVTTATRPVGDFLTGLAHLPTLAAENQDLKDQVADLQARVAAYGDTQARLARLAEQLSLRDLYPESISAMVIANGYSNFEYSITIDKGSNDGVKQYQPVVIGNADSRQLVGMVWSVTPISANVQLLIDRTFAVAGQLGTSRVTGLISGQGDQDLRLEEIPVGTSFPSGDEPEYVFTVSYEINGRHGRFPPGILIGQVSTVYEGTTETSDQVSVSPAVDFSSLEFVTVLTTDPTTAP